MIDRRLAVTLVGIAAAGGIGFAAARMTGDANTPAKAAEHEEGGEHAEEGEHEEGPKGFVALAAADAAAAGVELANVERGGGTEIMLPGRVEFAPGARASVGALLAGSVAQVHVGPGSRVAVGTPLVTLRSSEGASMRASIDVAKASVDAANAAEARERRLLAAGVVARQDWESARANALKAQAELRAANAQTAAIGSPGANGLAVIRSPIAGVVNRIGVAPGSVLAQGAEIAEVADPGKVELVFDVPPASSNLIRVGSTIGAQRPDGQVISGVVTAVAPGLAGGGAIVRVRPSGPTPPAGTVVSGRITAGAGGALVVPSDAVQTVEGRPSVFVLEQNGFRARPVVPGRNAGGKTEILTGLTGSERIAGKGAFLLKAELGKGAVEDEH